MSVYRVLSRTPFNGYKHGEQFEARLDPGMEARAITRGSIEVVEESVPSLTADMVRLPRAADAAGTERADAHTDSDQGRRRHRT